MAVARAQGQGGFTAIHAWLIVFVALWLTSTVLLVILYLDQEKIQTAADQMRLDLEKVIRAEGRRLPQWTEAKAGAGTSMVDLIEAARGDTAILVSGNAGDQPAALRQRLESWVERIRNDPHVQESGTPFSATSYADALDDVFGRFQAAAAARAEAEQGLARLTRELETLRGTQTGQKDEFVAQAEALRNEIATLRASYDESRARHAERIATFEQQREEMQKQCQEDIDQQRVLTRDLREQYDVLFARFEEQRAKLGQAQVSPLPLATARQGDGRVVMAKPGENVVYIDLGARDHLTLGLEFAVYDSLAGVPEDGRAKARIEVSAIYDDTALCRIVEMLTNEAIKVDDIINNPVYDRDRTLKFFVLGDFDLDGDNRPDPDGRQRIEAIIERSGGQLEPRLNAQVDFVVLGGPPPAPRRSPQFTEAEDIQYQAAKRAEDRYNELAATMKALAVPAMTQSVFLNFVAQARTPVLRQAGAASFP
jgi:hypothetical protein